MAFAFTVTVDTQDIALKNKITAAVTAAAADWATYVSGVGSIEIAVGFFTDAPVHIASTVPGDGTIFGKAVSVDGQRTVYEPVSTYELRTGVDSTPNGADITIKLNTSQLSNLWFSGDVTPLATSGRYDAISIFRHEIGHGLGLTSFRDPATGVLPANTEWVWDTLVGVDSASRGFFLGSNATQLNKSWVNLAPKQFSHVGADSTDPLSQDLMGVSVGIGRSVQISALDLALLADVTSVVSSTLPMRDIEKASPALNGGEANSASRGPSISSDDRYIAFYSSASDLVSGDANGASDIFRYDRDSNKVEKFSFGTGGIGANNGSSDPSISPDGKFIAFTSSASNMVAGDTGGWDEIFVTNGTSTIRASAGRNVQGVNNAEPDWPSSHPVITSLSETSFVVAYTSLAGNLVAGDARNVGKIFLFTRNTGGTESIALITKGVGGVAPDGFSDFASISRNGSIVAYESTATNLVASDTNAVKDIFVYNGGNGTTVRVAPSGVQPNNDSSKPSVSADGNFIAFQSLASNLVAGDTNSVSDIFVYNRQTGVIERISVTNSGQQGDNDSFEPSISGDGRFVTFWSRAQNLVPGSSSAPDVYVYDRLSHTVKLLSVNAANVVASSDSMRPKISADGNYVAFESAASNLAGKDPTGVVDVFVTNSRQFFTQGGAANDVIYSSADDEYLHGGGGANTVSYAAASTAVTVNLAAAGPQSTGGGGTDTLVSFVNVIGGGAGDRLTGDGNANILTGGLGNDTLDGGAGIDTAVFSGARSAYTLTRNGATLTVVGPDGTDTLTRIEKLTFSDGTVLSGLGVVPTDFNGNGQGDILFQHDNGALGIWLLNSYNVAQMSPAIPHPGAGWHAKDSGDFNADGKSDILWQHDNGTAAVWTFDGFTATGYGPALPNPGPAWHVIATADFNGDVKSDILWQHDNGALGVWLMNGITVATFSGAIPHPGDGWHAKDAADFNGDGKADILWQHDNGTPAVWLMDGINPIGYGPALSNPGPAWREVAAADFNADGKADILFQHDNGALGIWLMNGTTVGTFSGAIAHPGAGWHVKEAVDTNGDGKADIIWQHDNGTPAVWLFDGINPIAYGPALTNPGTAWHIV